MKSFQSFFPDEILRQIYAFDGTYRVHFEERVLPYLEKRRVFRVQSCSLRNLYLMVDEDYAKLMNSLTSPTFCSTIYFSAQQTRADYLALFDVLEIIPRHPDSTPVEFCNETFSWKEFCDDH
jgi:hypothetical protein